MSKGTRLLLAVLLLGLMSPSRAAASDGYLYEEGFEQPIETWTQQWDNATIGSRNRLSRIDGYSGQGIRITIPVGQHFGSSLELPLPGLNEAWQSYWFRIPFPVAPTMQGKTGMGFAGNHYANCGQGGAGNNPGCWTARQGYSCRGRNSGCEQLNFAFYLYHPDQTSEFGDLEPLAMRLEYGKWYCIQTYARMNTIGKADGVLAGFINGEWVYSRNVEFRTKANPSKIEGLWWDNYEGGKWTAETKIAFDYDELVVSERFVERKGCLQQTDAETALAALNGDQTTVPTTTAPTAPTSTTAPESDDEAMRQQAAELLHFIFDLLRRIGLVIP